MAVYLRSHVVSVFLAATVALAALAGLAPGRALAATTISNCSNLASVKSTLEAGGDIVINCGVVTLDLGSEVLIDSDTTIDGQGKTTLSGGNAHRVIRIVGNAGGVTVTLKRLGVVDGGVIGAYPAGEGGGVYADGTNGKQVTLHLEQTTFWSNTAVAGGAVYIDGASGSADLTMNETTFSDNGGYSDGGAVYISGPNGSAGMTATSTTFSGNSAYWFGGAAYINGSSGSASATVTNTTFSGNFVSSGGGAVFVDGGVGSASLISTNSTFSGNSAYSGGAVYSFSAGGGGSATVTLAATVFAASTGGHCYADTGSSFTSNDYNLADNLADTSCGLTNTNDQHVADAGLVSLADNGGLTQTHALRADSPAVDTAGPACAVSTDQRGIARPQDGNADGASACDIGAYERIATKLSGTSLQRFPAFNRVQAGDPVYVYFTYDGNGSTSILTSALVGVVSCKAGGAVVGTEQAQSATPLQYQSNRDRYLYIWKTNRAWYGSCRQLILTFKDGGEIRINATFVRARR